MRPMKTPLRRPTYAHLISALVIVAVLATLARLIYYAAHWRDLVSAAADFSWLEWGVVALFVAVLVWTAGRRDETD